MFLFSYLSQWEDTQSPLYTIDIEHLPFFQNVSKQLIMKNINKISFHNKKRKKLNHQLK